MAQNLTSILENLKHIFGIVYSETPPESVEESEENEDCPPEFVIESLLYSGLLPTIGIPGGHGAAFFFGHKKKHTGACEF